MGEAVIFPRMGTIKEAADASGLAIYRVRHLVASGKIRYVSTLFLLLRKMGLEPTNGFIRGAVLVLFI